jgi:hypothetical protein
MERVLTLEKLRPLLQHSGKYARECNHKADFKEKNADAHEES